ncbi:hypothetical protein ABZP36_009848 [Zizania latifolia]
MGVGTWGSSFCLVKIFCSRFYCEATIWTNLQQHMDAGRLIARLASPASVGAHAILQSGQGKGSIRFRSDPSASHFLRSTAFSRGLCCARWLAAPPPAFASAEFPCKTIFSEKKLIRFAAFGYGVLKRGDFEVRVLSQANRLNVAFCFSSGWRKLAPKSEISPN